VAPTSFNASLAARTIISNPDQCLRWIYVSSSDVGKLKLVFEPTKYESSFPPAVVICSREDVGSVVTAIQQSCPSKTVTIVQSTPPANNFQINNIYVIAKETQANIIGKFQKISFQLISCDGVSLPGLSNASAQFLIDEDCGVGREKLLAMIKESQVEFIPATSFASFSFEYFAGRRRSRAA
jgi:hypothetical protein